jgi:AcrR family transcriptional regulator
MSNWSWEDVVQSLRDISGIADDDANTPTVRERIGDTFTDAIMKHGPALMERFVKPFDVSDPKDRKRKRILEAATNLFIQQGYRKTSVDEVAREAGVAKGTVYLYYKTKSDLLMHAIGYEKMRFVGDVFEMFQQDISDRDKLREYLRQVFVLVTQMPLVSRLMSGDREILLAMEEADLPMKISMTELQTAFIGTLVRRAAPDLPRRAREERAKVLTGLMYSADFVGESRIRGGLSAERFAEVMADMLVDGIAAPSGAEGGEG